MGDRATQMGDTAPRPCVGLYNPARLTAVWPRTTLLFAFCFFSTLIGFLKPWIWGTLV